MKHNNIRVVAIDPSTKFFAVAFPLPDGAIGTAMLSPVPAVCIPFFRLLTKIGINTVVYENCYSRLNIKTFAKLYHIMESFREELEVALPTLTFIALPPSKWQAAVLLEVGENTHALRKGVSKVRSKVLATSLLSRDPKSQDICDAVCILHAVTKHNIGLENA